MTKRALGDDKWEVKQKWPLVCASCGKQNGETNGFYTEGELKNLDVVLHPKGLALNLCH